MVKRQRQFVDEERGEQLSALLDSLRKDEPKGNATFSVSLTILPNAFFEAMYQTDMEPTIKDLLWFLNRIGWAGDFF